MNVSQSGYFAWISRTPSKRMQENNKIGKEIKDIFIQSRCNYGKRRIRAQLVRKGIFCSLERIVRLMKLNQLYVKTKRKFKSTTDSNHTKRVAPNLLKQNFIVRHPNRVWSSDISYIKTNEGWLYLYVVLDLYSRSVIGWPMAERMQATLVENAIIRAIKRCKSAKNLVFHSDRGSQYCSDAVTKLLAALNFQQSMSSSGNCYDNAITETFFQH